MRVSIQPYKIYNATTKLIYKVVLYHYRNVKLKKYAAADYISYKHRLSVLVTIQVLMDQILLDAVMSHQSYKIMSIRTDTVLFNVITGSYNKWEVS